MPKIGEMFPSRYITADELGEKSYNVTIKEIGKESMRPSAGAPEVDKYVIYFNETKRGIVLGKTLATQIVKIIGSDDTDQWVGKQIQIYSEQVKVAGEWKRGIRARAVVTR